MRQQYYVHNDVVHNFACAIIYSAYNDYEIAKRGMIRSFKKRQKGNFKAYKVEYQTLKKFFQGNMWFDYLDIEPEYFNRLMEDKEHDKHITFN